MRTRGGILSAVDAAAARSADAVQFFASNPRAWAGPRVDEDLALAFRAGCRNARISPVFLHAPYLVNVASQNGDFRRKSVELSRASLVAADALGAAGVVVHAGAGGPGERRDALDRAASSLDAIAAAPGEALVVVELMAGSSGAVASTFPEAAELFDALSDPGRFRLCIDTCHLFAAGYVLEEPEGVEECFAELRASGLGTRLVLVHANDAEFPRGSRRDRHANIGGGHIGRDGFRAILAQPAVRRCTVLCETPGDEEQTRRDVETLRELAE